LKKNSGISLQQESANKANKEYAIPEKQLYCKKPKKHQHKSLNSCFSVRVCTTNTNRTHGHASKSGSHKDFTRFYETIGTCLGKVNAVRET